MCDELFDESGDEKDIQELSWRKTTDGINKDGCRAGIETGQEERLQDGFNSTFSASSKLLYMVSALRGQISGKLSYNLMKPGTFSTDQTKQLEMLLKDLLEYETELLNFSNKLYCELQSNQVEFDKLTTDRYSVNGGGELSFADESHLALANKTSTSADSLVSSSEGTGLSSDIVSDALTSHDSVVYKINNFKQRFSKVLQFGR